MNCCACNKSMNIKSGHARACLKYRKNKMDRLKPGNIDIAQIQTECCVDLGLCGVFLTHSFCLRTKLSVACDQRCVRAFFGVSNVYVFCVK